MARPCERLSWYLFGQLLRYYPALLKKEEQRCRVCYSAFAAAVADTGIAMPHGFFPKTKSRFANAKSEPTKCFRDGLLHLYSWNRQMSVLAMWWDAIAPPGRFVMATGRGKNPPAYFPLGNGPEAFREDLKPHTTYHLPEQELTLRQENAFCPPPLCCIVDGTVRCVKKTFSALRRYVASWTVLYGASRKRFLQKNTFLDVVRVWAGALRRPLASKHAWGAFPYGGRNCPQVSRRQRGGIQNERLP